MQIPETVIRDTVAAVFRNRAYGQPSLLSRLWQWLLDLFYRFLDQLNPGRLPMPVFWTVVIIGTAIITGLAARAFYLAYTQRKLAANEWEGGAGQRTADAWADAARLAARGDHTAAAHALYAGLLFAIARTGEVELDESKTIGDYIRELARKSSARLQRFREFARSYETVIYGLGTCDRERFERLQTLARGIVGAHG